MGRYVPHPSLTVSNESALALLGGVILVGACIVKLKEIRNKSTVLEVDNRSDFEKTCDKITKLLTRLRDEEFVVDTATEVECSLITTSKKKVLEHLSEVLTTGQRIHKATKSVMNEAYKLNDRNDESDDDLADDFEAMEEKLYNAMKPFLKTNINGFKFSYNAVSYEAEYEKPEKLIKLKALEGKELIQVLEHAIKLLELYTTFSQDLRYCNYLQGQTNFGDEYRYMVLDTAKEAYRYVNKLID